jgi:UDP-3-O-[3-hydroxymyristoyl] glucosamine N-acyltransferase
MTVITTGELAERLGAVLEGDSSLPLRGVADLEGAREGQLAFAGGPKYYAAAAACGASAVLVPEGADLGETHPTLLRTKDVGKAFVAACLMFAPKTPERPKSIDPRAWVSPEAKIGRDVSVGPFAVVEAGAEIGDGTVLYPQTYVGYGAVLGKGCLLYPFAMVREHCRLGDRVILHGGAAIGADGFGYDVDAKGVRTKIPQLGIVVLEDDVEIGANTTIDRARFGETRVGRGTKIDNLVQIAHNCVIGEDSVMCAQSGMAGTCTLGKRVICAGQAGLAGHLKLGDDTVVGAQAGVPKSLPGGQVYLGSPAIPRLEFGKQVAMVNALPKLKEQLKALEKRVAELEAAAGNK